LGKAVGSTAAIQEPIQLWTEKEAKDRLVVCSTIVSCKTNKRVLKGKDQEIEFKVRSIGKEKGNEVKGRLRSAMSKD
jgi:hypothetical protein